MGPLKGMSCLLLLVLAACEPAETPPPDAPPTKPQLAKAARVANEAASDEARDISQFGGNAAAMAANQQ